eukprot:UC4_evm1s63
MTLNTFHFAGNSDMNVTLGIPRLREILMTASPNIKTPMMEINIEPGMLDAATGIQNSLKRVTIADILKKVSVTRYRHTTEEHGAVQRYEVRLDFIDPDEYTSDFAVSWDEILMAVESNLIMKIHASMKKAFGIGKSSHTRLNQTIENGNHTDSHTIIKNNGDKTRGDSDDGDDDSSDEDDANETDGNAQRKSRDMVFYGEGRNDEYNKEENTNITVESPDLSTNTTDEGIYSSHDDIRSKIKSRVENLQEYNYDEGVDGGIWACFVMDFPPKTKQILVVDIVEKLA